MSDWSIETDEEAATRNTTIDGRFIVCHPVESMIEALSRKNDAFACAERWDNPAKSGCQPCQVEVIDRLARVGQPRRWRRFPIGASHCFERGDWLTMESLWKCVEKNGVEPKQLEDFSCRIWS